MKPCGHHEKATVMDCDECVSHAVAGLLVAAKQYPESSPGKEIKKQAAANWINDLKIKNSVRGESIAQKARALFLEMMRA